MARLIFGLVAMLLAGTVEAHITTEILQANGLNFTCSILKHTSAHPDAPLKEVMFLHGFPMYRKWWNPLLFYWDRILQEPEEGRILPPVSVHAVACDLRGYSPGASPDDIRRYGYLQFGHDVGELANVVGFQRNSYHLVAHDHGAGLAWELAAYKSVNLLSLTTMSVPHNDLMSEALCGKNEDREQVIASNYFNQFALPDSAIQNDGSITKLFVKKVGAMPPEEFQKLLWWYNGTMVHYWSMPRVVSDEEVQSLIGTPLEETAQVIMAVRNAIPMEERPCIPSTWSVGPIRTPTLFICGVDDRSILCNNSFAHDFAPGFLPNYEHANFYCGHEFFKGGDCRSQEESMAVMNKITSFVLTNQTGARTAPLEGSRDDSSASSMLETRGKAPLLILCSSFLMALSSLMW